MEIKKERFEKLYFDAYGKLFLTAYSVTKNKQEAEDVMQDSMEKAYRNFDKYDGNRNFSTWMSTIVRNTAIDRLRGKEKSKNVASLDTTMTVNSKSTTWDIEDRTQNIVENYEKKEMCEQIHQAIQELPADLREVMHLMVDDETQYSYQEIADTLGEPIGVIRSKVHRARLLIQNRVSFKNSTKNTMKA